MGPLCVVSGKLADHTHMTGGSGGVFYTVGRIFVSTNLSLVLKASLLQAMVT
jgi:hypothetical protein